MVKVLYVMAFAMGGILMSDSLGETLKGIAVFSSTGLVGFFLVRFYLSTENTKKKVDQLLTNDAVKMEMIKQIKKDIDELKDK